MTNEHVSDLVRNIGANITMLLACQPQDHLAWMRGSGFLGDPSAGSTILDYWELKDGDRVIMTNRYQDLPDWFDLTPMEVRGKAAYALLPRVEAGEARTTPLNGPNIWRVRLGDKLAWIGPSRPHFPARNGVVAIFDCSADFLIAGQPATSSTLDDWQGFGAPSTDAPDPRAVTSMRYALEIVKTIRQGLAPINGWAISSK